jgi:hypothetical protein
MFQLVNSLGKRRVKAAPEDLLDPQHRSFTPRIGIAEPGRFA